MTTASGTELDGESPTASGADGGVIVARAGRYYRNARYLMALICVGLGLWFAYDGWVAWPRENDRHAQVSAKLDTARATGNKDEESRLQEELKSVKHHGGFDIPLQRILGGALPLAGVALLCWALYNSRGSYRFADNTLHAPGHPPVPVDAIRQIDKQKWERKGIAYIDYDLGGAGGGKDRVKLDDFVYEQAPTQAILARIESLVAPESQSPEDAQPESLPTNQHE
jgi:hypothetical protein